MTTTNAAHEHDAGQTLSRQTRWALAGLSLSMLLSSLGTSIANVSLPTLTQVFTARFQDVQWVVLAYLLSITALIVTAGRLGDMLGRRRLLLTGIMLFSTASVAGGLATNLWFLVVTRAAQGAGAAAMMALTMAFIGEIVPTAQTGRAMGLLGTMSAVGTALGPSLGGFLIAATGWRSIFLVNVPLGILAALLVYRYLPSERQRSPTPHAGFDWLGTSLLAGTLAAYALAMTIGRGHFGLLSVVLLGPGAHRKCIGAQHPATMTRKIPVTDGADTETEKSQHCAPNKQADHKKEVAVKI